MFTRKFPQTDDDVRRQTDIMITIPLVYRGVKTKTEKNGCMCINNSSHLVKVIVGSKKKTKNVM